MTDFRVPLCLSVALVVVGCQQGPEPVATKSSTPTKVEIAKPTRATVRKTIEQPGQVEAAETSPIHARTVGLVKLVKVDIGDRVAEGQVLAELSLPEVVAELAQAKASLIQAEAGRTQASAAVKVEQAKVAGSEAKLTATAAGVRRADAELVRRKTEYARMQSLARESAVTSSLVDEAASIYHAAEAARDEAMAHVQYIQATIVEARASAEKAIADESNAIARIAVAKAAVEHADAMLSYATITSPFPGVITRRHVDTGQLVGGFASNSPLFVAARTDLMTVSVVVPEVAAPQVKLGATAEIKVQALGGKPTKAKVTRSAFSIDPASRGLRVEIDLENPDELLRPGMYTVVTVVLDEHPNVLTIPVTALIKDGDKSVCVKVEDGKARRVPIKLGIVDGVNAEVVEGLTESDIVVKTMPASLVEGQPVVVP